MYGERWREWYIDTYLIAAVAAVAAQKKLINIYDYDRSLVSVSFS